jgi:enediyne biosynthesis protein E4
MGAGRSLILAAIAVASGVTGGLRLPAQSDPLPEAIRFTDVTRASGLKFRHFKGGNGGHYYPEQFGGGAAFFDYDSDGRLDVFFVQGAPMPGYSGSRPSGNVLYKNNGNGTFSDVTLQAGLRDGRYGLGVVAADYDNDGDTDVFVTNLDGNALFRNDGRGRFTDVTELAGVRAPAMSTGAAFLDYNKDGWLDLFVVRYTDYSFESDARCIDPTSVAKPVTVAQRRTDPLPPDTTVRFAYCGPPAYKGTSSRLYRNNKDGTFTDVSGPSGIVNGIARGLGVAVADFDQDGHPDIFVASDMSPNLLFMNAGNGTFREQALTAGVAVGALGKAYAGMGVDAADYDNDGDADLFITNYENEPSSLYRNEGDGTFTDASASSGIGRYSLLLMKWGCRFVDLDLDGHLDLLVLNGHVNDYLEAPSPKSGFALGRVSLREGYTQRAQIYRNNGAYGTFADASWTAGPYFLEKHVGRGAAFGDVDNDGDWDVVAVNNDEEAALLRNDTSRQNRWVRLELHGKGCNRDAIGARVRLKSGAVTQTRYVSSGGSYLSDHDRRLLFGVPGASGPVTAEIQWPCGATETLSVNPGTSSTIEETNCRLAKPRK